jgi:probable rRNA maturation factor
MKALAPNIRIYNQQKDLPIDKSSVKDLVRSVLKHLRVECRELGLYFVSETKICALHQQFFQDPTPTDCISFPLDNDYLGEIFVCPSVAIAYAKKRGLDPYTETTLYVVHGLLHLIGLDDLEEKKRRIMRKKERSCMRHLIGLGLLMRPKMEQ